MDGPAMKRQNPVTIGSLIKCWLEQLEIRPSTRAAYEHAATLSRNLWRMRASDLTSSQIADWLITLKKRRGTRTIQVAGGVLKRSLAYGVELRILGENPFVSKIPTAKAKRAVPFTDEEVRQILLTAQRDRLGGAIVLAFLCGMRQGEIFGLQWRDIDWEIGQVTIERPGRRLPWSGDCRASENRARDPKGLGQSVCSGLAATTTRSRCTRRVRQAG
jgi:integrase